MADRIGAVALMLPGVTKQACIEAQHGEKREMSAHNERFAFFLVGGIIGLIVGILMRPSIPLLGQPPIDVALNALIDPRGEFDRAYQSSFLWALGLAAGGDSRRVTGLRP